MSVDILIVKVVWICLAWSWCWKLCLELSVGAIPKNTKKAKNAINVKKAGKGLREAGLDRRGPGGSAESEARPFRKGSKDELLAETNVGVFL